MKELIEGSDDANEAHNGGCSVGCVGAAESAKSSKNCKRNDFRTVPSSCYSYDSVGYDNYVEKRPNAKGIGSVDSGGTFGVDRLYLDNGAMTDRPKP